MPTDTPLTANSPIFHAIQRDMAKAVMQQRLILDQAFFTAVATPVVPLTRTQRFGYWQRRQRANWAAVYRAVKLAARGIDPHCDCHGEY